jgi:LysM repeat protein
MRYMRTFRGRLVAASLSTLLVASCFAHPARADQNSYVVQPNDTLSAIALRFGTTVPALVALNHLSNSGFIVAGQTLVLFGSYSALTKTQATSTAVGSTPTTYVVQVGDTLSSISGKFGVAFQPLASLNALSSPYIIRIGQTLLIPATNDNPSQTTLVTTQPTSASNVAPVTGGVTYTVVQGDTLSAISNRFGVTADAIAASNHLSTANLITIGQQLVIPAVDTSGVMSSAASAVAPAVSVAPATTAQTSSYAVQAGDTLSAIAARYGMTVDAIAAQNNISANAIIAVGQQLTVPANVVTTAPEPFVDQATIGGIITTVAQQAGVSVSLIKALAWQESGWQMVTATDGGMGVMQLMPDSVTWAGGTLLGQTIDPFNATDNIRAGVAMMSYYLQVYDGDVRRALAAYHQGMASVDNEGIRPDTEQYIANILALQQQYGG